MNGAMAVFIGQKNMDETAAKGVEHLIEVEGGEVFAYGVAEAAEGTEEDEVGGEPDRASPIGVAALDPL